MQPDLIIETSWEVCNKVGGIYTVLSTRAATMTRMFGDNAIFVGPCLEGNRNTLFTRDDSVLDVWQKQAKREGLNVIVGRWNVPGNPVAILVDFAEYYSHRDEIYAEMWEKYGVDSLHSYGDYDEASMFGWAVGKVVESLCGFFADRKHIVFQANEWTMAFSLLYVKSRCPKVATVFTTHATSIGRSIAGNGKPLYDYFEGYNGDQMAIELNMQSKHSAEKVSARESHCFTTVSDITARECRQLLNREPDMVLPNGFEADFIPSASEWKSKRKAARKRIFDICQALTGKRPTEDALIIATSGRNEFRNKGIDVFIKAVNRLRFTERCKREIVALVEVPGWVEGRRSDLVNRLNNGTPADARSLSDPLITHTLHNTSEDRILGEMHSLWMDNASNVRIIYIPCYLLGNDGILNISYYDQMPAVDISVYASYYEPWGYTPLESIAFHVPTITTDKSGFGAWAESVVGHQPHIEDGVEVLHRGDNNTDELVDNIAECILRYSEKSDAEIKECMNNAYRLSKKALWQNFYKNYLKAYAIALSAV